MSAEPAPDLDLALRALADANRRAILTVIRGGPRAVGSLAERVGLSQDWPAAPGRGHVTCSPFAPTAWRRSAPTWTASGRAGWRH